MADVHNYSFHSCRVHVTKKTHPRHHSVFLPATSSRGRRARWRHSRATQRPLSVLFAPTTIPLAPPFLLIHAHTLWHAGNRTFTRVQTRMFSCAAGIRDVHVIARMCVCIGGYADHARACDAVCCLGAHLRPTSLSLQGSHRQDSGLLCLHSIKVSCP